MKASRAIALGSVAAAFLFMATTGFGQIVINELVEDEQDFETTDVPDTREFIELYNAGGSTVNIGDWTLNYWQLGSTSGGGSYFSVVDTIPTGTMLAAGDYYVLGPAEVANVDLVLPSNTDLFPNLNTIFELWNGPRETGTLIDALGVDTFRNQELENANQAQLNQIAAGETVGPDAKGGWWGQVESNNAHPSDPSFPNLPMSLGRYLDGRDNNINGLDFGMIPATPGASNNLSQLAAHEVSDVNSTAVGTVLRDDYYASFKLPRVISPGTVSVYNPNAIPESPQEGNAIIAWDETGGGNADYSHELVDKFELYAYIDTADLNLAQATVQSEASTYGIGTTDPLFGTPNQAGLLTLTSTQNGNTGIGWHIQRAEAAGGGATTTLLQLIDFNDGGDSVQADNDWQIMETIDLSGVASGWHILGIDYDPATGDVIATHNDDEYTFTTATDLTGTFYVGYRENLPGVSGSGKSRPPTYDLFIAPPEGLVGDYNNDGKVDAADYVVWRKTNVNGPQGYTDWVENFGAMQSGTGGGGVGGVPEPSSMALVMLGLLVVGAQRRRTR